MQNLKTNANLARPDETYNRLIHAHDGLAKDESDALNARFILILLNHIGDETTLEEAILLAKTTVHTVLGDNR